MIARASNDNIAKAESIVFSVKQDVPCFNRAFKHVAMIDIAHYATNTEVKQQQRNSPVRQLSNCYHVL